MFFVLSKTLGIMLLPVNFLIGIGLIGAALWPTRFAVLGRRLTVGAAVLLAVIAFSPVGNLLIYSLESRFPPWNPAHGVPDGIIVLGGSIDPDVSLAHKTTIVAHSADRIIVAAELARKYPDARIVFTGGNANLLSNDAKEGDYAGEVLENLGVAKSRLTIERQSRNTVENAEFSKALVKPQPGERWLLVTSAYHMPRSVGLFRKAGFPVEAYPVDWRVGKLGDLFVINMAMDGLSRTDIAIREWLGLVAYRVNGKTDALFPGPTAP
ncbi:YdcF family protein [Bradyrhizobium genosp. L]|uniref:YdcF family protein n=1 Tax=Bradyrhizobium genosp. L TaxID=83637 RepID=UPI0018A32D06|nr:YdcF family protein [Bradyrhizobium genosp. L]QPF82130.1 YdcF family protein [Bradyrhizobium genosp. L]